MQKPLKPVSPLSSSSESFTDEVREALFIMKQAQELASFGNWVWDIENNNVTWSDTLYEIYGLDKLQFKATFEGYQELLHPNDRDAVVAIISNALETKNDVIFEERIIRPSGEIRYLKSWGCVKTDCNSFPQKIIGACLDITETKLKEKSILESKIALKKLVNQQAKHIKIIEKQNKKLSDISYIQSHIVRAPLAKIMGLTDLLINHTHTIEEKDELAELLAKVAVEFDKVINDIIEKTGSENTH